MKKLLLMTTLLLFANSTKPTNWWRSSIQKTESKTKHWYFKSIEYAHFAWPQITQYVSSYWNDAKTDIEMVQSKVMRNVIELHRKIEGHKIKANYAELSIQNSDTDKGNDDLADAIENYKDKVDSAQKAIEKAQNSISVNMNKVADKAQVHLEKVKDKLNEATAAETKLKEVAKPLAKK